MKIVAILVVLVLIGSLPTIAAEPCAPALDKEAGILASGKSIRREINLHNLYNGLHLSVEQMKALHDLATAALALRDSLYGQTNSRAQQVVKIYDEILGHVRAGRRIPRDLEGLGGLMELAEKRLRKKFVKGINALEAKAWAVLSPAQKEVFKTYEPCLVPPKNLKDPVRVGQAATHEGETKILNLSREIAAADFDVEVRRVLSVHLHHLEKFLGPIAPKLREKELRRMTEVCRAARLLSPMEFALQVDKLAVELGLGRQKDRFKAKTEEFIEMVSRLQGGRIGRVASHFLDPLAIGILKERMERAEDKASTGLTDLGSVEGAPSCEDGRCGRDPTTDRPGMKKKYNIDELITLLDLPPTVARKFKSITGKAKQAHMKLLQTPGKDGQSPFDRMMKAQALPPGQREGAMNELFGKLSDLIPGRDTSYMEHILLIKISMDRQYRRLLAPATYEELVATVADFLDHIDMDDKKNKPLLADLARKCGMDHQVTLKTKETVQSGQLKVWKLLSIPDSTGRRPLDFILQLQTLAPEKRREAMKEFLSVLSRVIPGREITYAQEIEKIKSDVLHRLETFLSAKQMAVFRSIDLLDVKMD